jgi:hypothetical protein
VKICFTTRAKTCQLREFTSVFLLMEIPDVDDYMSEKYLVSEQLPKKKYGLKKRFDDKPKPLKQLEKERLEDGLSNPLDSTNKGVSSMRFSLLALVLVCFCTW